MDLTKSILEDIRAGVGLSPDTSNFDIELLMHINVAIGALKQNGVGKNVIVSDTTTTWADLQDPDQSDRNEYFKMVPLFIMLSAKLLFDPPPPSTVQYHQASIEQLLWRLKVAYETPVTTTTTICE